MGMDEKAHKHESIKSIHYNISIETYMKIEQKCNYEKRRNTIRKRLISIAYTAAAMKAELDKRSNVVPFDSDSAPVGVDNRCSVCINHISEDFIGNLVDSD